MNLAGWVKLLLQHIRRQKPKPPIEGYFQMAVKSVAGKRPNNEDNFYMAGRINKEQEDFFFEDSCSFGDCNVVAVLDGMGGLESGELASLTAAECIKRLLDRKETVELGTVIDSYKEMSADVLELQERCGVPRGNIGTTCVMLYTDGIKFWIFNCGDSRAYLWRNNTVQPLTQDQTLYEWKVREGYDYDGKEEEKEEDKHALTSYIGADPEHSFEEPCPKVTDGYVWEDGDCILLCSDGISDVCSEADIEGIFRKKSKKNNGKVIGVGDRAISFVKEALKKGSSDNITCLLVQRVCEEG